MIYLNNYHFSVIEYNYFFFSAQYPAEKVFKLDQSNAKTKTANQVSFVIHKPNQYPPKNVLQEFNVPHKSKKVKRKSFPVFITHFPYFNPILHHKPKNCEENKCLWTAGMI